MFAMVQELRDFFSRMIAGNVQANAGNGAPDESIAHRGASRRRFPTWSASSGDPDAAMLPDLPFLRHRSLDLFRNSPTGRGALKTILNNAVGYGLTPQATPDRDALGLSDVEARSWSMSVEREWSLFSDSVESDFYRQSTFGEQQIMAMLTRLALGDCFVLLPYLPRPGVPFDLRVQLVDPERVTNPNEAQDNDKIAGGIERNDDGVVTAIHIQSPHPGSISLVRPKWKRIPMFGSKTGRRNVLHIIDRELPGQSRGEPVLTPVIEQIKQISRYSQLEIAAAVVNASLAIGVEYPAEVAGSELVTEDGENSAPRPWEEQQNFRFGPGTIFHGAPGAQLKTISASRPATQFDPFFVANMKQIGMGLDIPFELLMKHFSASYSASRAALLEAWKSFRTRREGFNRQFNQPVYEECLIESVMRGRIPAPRFLTDARTRTFYSWAVWNGPSMGQIDQVKEVEAARLREKYGYSTGAIESAALTGTDYESNARILAAEQQLRRGLGLSEPGAAAPAEPAPEPEDSNGSD